MSEKVVKKDSIPVKIAVALIKFYRFAISPQFPSCCRFVPSCPEYGPMAFQRYGFKKGLVLTWKRF